MLEGKLVLLSAGFVATGCIAMVEDPEAGEDNDLEAAALTVGEAPAPKPQEVSFGRDAKEDALGIRIRDGSHKQPKVVYSVRLPSPSSAEQLRLRGEVTLSRCNTKDIAGLSGDSKITPCDSKAMKQSPYGYNPRFSAAFVLADGPGDPDGVRVSPWSDTTCTEGQHHCALALPEATVDDVPDAAEKFVNLVVTADANGHNARSWDVMEVEQHHGALYVTRVAPGAELHAIQKASKNLLAAGKMGVDQTEDEGDKTQVKHLMYQVALHGLQPGDVIDVDARMRAILGGYSCDPLITAEVLVTQNAGADEPSKPHDERLTVRNGRNCSDHSSDGCKYVESGAVRLHNGTPSTMYVSYLAQAVRSCAAPNGGDKWHADPSDGFLKVNVRR
jgi:hypothetical protein